MLGLLLFLAAAHAFWFIVQPDSCPPESGSCSGNPLPVYSFLVSCVLLNVINVIDLKRAGYPRSFVVDNAILLAISTLLIVAAAAFIAVRIAVLGHPT